MDPFRLVIVVAVTALIGGGFYLSYNGIWRTSMDLDRSVRIGGPGGYGGGRVK